MDTRNERSTSLHFVATMESKGHYRRRATLAFWGKESKLKLASNAENVATG